MLIDKEDETLSELDAVEEQKQLPETEPLAQIPDKYREKSLEDVVKMHLEAEKLIERQGKEVGEIRKLAVATENFKESIGVGLIEALNILNGEVAPYGYYVSRDAHSTDIR